jgi:hypothetical protein
MNNSFIFILMFLFVFVYFLLVYKIILLKKEYIKIKNKNILFEKYFNAIQENKLMDEENVHQENFIKFLSESRDWAYEYIENVQSGLNKFVLNVGPEINYFDEYGEVGSAYPHYFSMKKISESYKELKQLLPKDAE